MHKRYIIHPGYVRSENDGQRHYISAAQLIQLYGLNQTKDKIIIRNQANKYFELYRYDRDIHLYPQYHHEDYTRMRNEIEIIKRKNDDRNRSSD